MRMRKQLVGRIAGGALVVAASFVLSLWAMETFWPRTVTIAPPVLANTPPLPAVARSSTVVAPVAVAYTAIRDSLERYFPVRAPWERDEVSAAPAAETSAASSLSWYDSRRNLSSAS